MMLRETVSPRRSVAFAASLALMVSALAFSAPARAGDDNSSGNPFASVLGFVGMQPEKEKENIDYRARPPLVIPPGDALPQPAPAAAGRPASWPIDPDEAARRRAAADSRRPAPQMNQASTIGENGMRLTKEELLAGRSGLPDPDTRTPTSSCQVGSGTQGCSGSNTVWEQLKTKVGLANHDNDIVAGAEPSRDYLTEPPPGYRRPTSSIAAAPVRIKAAPDAADSYGYIREQARHKTTVDDE